jgi:hypothetical protein
MELIKNMNRAWSLAKDWRFADKQIQLGKKEVKRGDAVNMIGKIMQVTQQLTQKEIRHWRMANQYAIDVDYPNRALLYQIYDDAMHDLHLKGAIRNRKLAVMGKPFRLKDASGKPVPDAVDMLTKKWFREFMSLALDARFYGHSLIQFGDVIRDDANDLRFSEVELIPRHHVSPEYGTLLKNASDDPTKGIPYRGTPLMNWAIEVGKKRDLGELNSAAKETISKKYVLQFWDAFAEIFGMPIRMATTSSRDPKDKRKIENMLDQMGSAAWGLFPEGTSIEMIGSKQTDSFEVYDKRIMRANSEMSKHILGQTMTMDNGSSLSQAKVHENVADDISDADRTFIHDVVNDDLLPLLIKHGWPFKGLRFEWDDSYYYTPQEMKEIENMLLTHYEVDPKYFTEKYGVTINGTKQQGVQLKKKSTRETLPHWLIDTGTE